MAAPAALTLQPQPWHLAAMLASAFARPVRHALLDAGPAGAMPRATVDALARHPSFEVPVNRAVSRLMGLAELELTPAYVARLGSDAGARLCALLLSQPIALVVEAALLVTAAVLHKEVVRIIFKASRDKIRLMFGDAGFEVATREALLFHGSLAELSAGLPLAALLADDTTLEDGRKRSAAYGLTVLAGFVDTTEPALGRLFRLRAESAAPAGLADRTGMGMVTDRHGDHLARLLRRRMRPWSALIG